MSIRSSSHSMTKISGRFLVFLEIFIVVFVNSVHLCNFDFLGGNFGNWLFIKLFNYGSHFNLSFREGIDKFTI
jgi:hypothetical protein